jgi:chromosome segregation ATPase
VTDDDGQIELLQEAYEELARRVVAERLLFADRLQEAIDGEQRAVAERDPQIAELTEDLQAVRARVETLHGELRQAHAELEAMRRMRLFRAMAKLRLL